MSSGSLFDLQPDDSRDPNRARQLASQCDVGIIFNSSLESGCTEDRLTAGITLQGDGFAVKQGLFGGHRAALTIARANSASAQSVLTALLTGHRPRLIVAAGFGSGLTERVERGDLVVADSIVGPADDVLTVDRVLNRVLLTNTARLHVGRILAVEQPDHRPAEKRAVGERHAALAANAHFWTIGKHCHGENVPFVAVSVILDAVDDDLPPQWERLASRMTVAQRIGAIAGSLVRRPSSVKDMWNMYEASLAASLRLAKFLEAIVGST